MYDFDKVINRRGTHSYKWDRLDQVFGNPDLTAMWVADMDWETPDFIRNAIKEQIENNTVWGYACDPDDWWPTVLEWIRSHHQWDVNPDWITYIPGIVRGLGYVCNSLLAKDAKIIVQPPVYHPFFLVPQGLGHEVLWNPLTPTYDENGNLQTYEMDFDNLEEVIRNIEKDGQKNKLLPSPSNGEGLGLGSAALILCNPHNPAGICWSKETLQRLAHIAKEHNILVISDEIHCDLALFGHKHIPFATVSEEARENSITFSAPTKTFNMAGIVSSWCIVPNDNLRQKFFSWLEAGELNEAAMFAPVATTAALKYGEPWRKEMLAYLEDNIRYVEQELNSLPLKGVGGAGRVFPVRPQASYLVWLDCRSLCRERNLTHQDLVDLFEKKAGLALNSGIMFGQQGEGFMRLNVGCPRSVIAQALQKLKAVL